MDGKKRKRSVPEKENRASKRKQTEKKPKIEKEEEEDVNEEESFHFAGPLTEYGIQLKFEKESDSDEWRQLCVSAGITLYNLHRAFQYAFKPTQRDKTIEDMKHQFTTPDGTLIKSEKKAKLGEQHLVIDAQCFHYVGKDNKTWTITIEDIKPQKYKEYLPRMCGSSVEDDELTDKANLKLMLKRCTSNTSHNKQKRQGPRGYCMIGTDPTPAFLNAMRKPLQAMK